MNWGLIGHEWAVEQLEQSLRARTAAHAYLFAGTSGIGKALLAQRMAQALLCEQASGRPCLACRACRRIERGNHPDLRLAGMASQAAGLKPDEAARQKELKIGTVREWQRDLALSPFEGDRRVLILHDAERLNEEASNAMLKTLEEPPSHVTIILVANSSDLLPTIVSRCRVLRLRPLPRQQVAAALLERGADPARATLLAAWSGGRIGWALQLLEQPEVQTRREEQLEALVQLQAAGRGAGMAWAEQRAKEYRAGEQETVFAWLELWQGWWRDVLLTAVDYPAGVVNLDRRSELERTAARHTLADLYAFTLRVGQAARQLRENGNPQLVLESLALHMPA